jgi:hypothetical protein
MGDRHSVRQRRLSLAARESPEEEVRIAESVDDPYNLVYASYSMGLLYLRKGDFHRAISVLERGLGLCRAKYISQWFPPLASALG